MENKNIRWLIVCIASLFLAACSNDKEGVDDYPDHKADVNASVNIDLRALPLNTSCDMYIFWKTTGSADDYAFKEKVIITSSPTNIHFRNQDLANKSYRFLFLTFEGNSPEIEVINKETGIWDEAIKWNDMVIRAQNRELSGSNFYGIVDKTGNEIMDDGTIEGTVTRMVGQLIVDIFKINGSIDNPIDVTAGSVASVLDRVYKIDVNYEGMTQDVAFDASNTIIENAEWGGSYTQTFSVNMNESNFQVPIDGTVEELEKVSTLPSGSVRIKGLYLFPSNKNIRCKLTFYYYDTTAACGNPSHTHTKECFESKTLILNLPEENNNELLSVFANHFTQNKAGIRYNRIIDLKAEGSYQFITKWANEPSGN